MLYVDTSAVAKTILKEPESTAVRAWLRRRPHEVQVSSALLRTELRRAVGRALSRADELGQGQYARQLDTIRRRLTQVRLVRLTDELLDRAGELSPPTLRSLDAVHLATAVLLADQLTSLVTYDPRLADAARSAGLQVVSPGV